MHYIYRAQWNAWLSSSHLLKFAFYQEFFPAAQIENRICYFAKFNPIISGSDVVKIK